MTHKIWNKYIFSLDICNVVHRLRLRLNVLDPGLDLGSGSVFSSLWTTLDI
jgi:hypothetical protein